MIARDSVKEAARNLIELGHYPIPVPPRSKNPNRRGWQKERHTGDARFSEDDNIGILLGIEGSKLADVDLDCPEAIELAPQYLPPTTVKHGRASAPRSHYWYVTDEPVPATIKLTHPHDTKDTFVELRGRGGQTVIPPSIHPEGEPLKWDITGPFPQVKRAELEAAVRSLYAAVCERRGVSPAAPAPAPADPIAPPPSESDLADDEKVYAWLCGHCAPPQTGDDHNTAVGSVTMTLAVHLNDAEQAWRVLCRWGAACSPPCAEHELLRQLKSAAKKQARQKAEKTAKYEMIAGRKAPSSEARAASGDDDRSTPDSPDQATGEVPKVPEIEDGVKEYVVNTKAIAALANASIVYQRAGHLVRIVHNKRPPKAFTRFPEAPRIDELKPPTLRELLSICANWVKFDGRSKDRIPTRPPDACVKAVLARREWEGIPPLEGVIQTPTFLANGTVLSKQGYDPGTGLFLEGGEGILVPDSPTKDDAVAAYKALLEPFEEFKFISGNADACVAAILSVLAWDAFDGPSPMYYFAASTPGSGKGLAVWVISHIALGRDTAAMTAPSTEEEWGKSVLTVAIAGEPLVLLDNVRGMVKSSALEAVLTASEFAGRILGVTEKAHAALRSVWLLTGNNCSFSTDLIRRTIPIEIDPCGENPSERKFKRNLKKWIPENRERLVTAALTLLRAFHLAGRPHHGGPQKGSFESWDDLVRSAIIWAGGCDPCAGVQALRESGDGDKDSLRALLHALHDMFGASGKTAREIVDASDSTKVKVDSLGDRAALTAKAGALRDALLALDPKNTSGRPNQSTLPYALRERKGQIVGDLRLECSKDRKGASLWSVVKIYKATEPAVNP